MTNKPDMPKPQPKTPAEMAAPYLDAASLGLISHEDTVRIHEAIAKDAKAKTARG